MTSYFPAARRIAGLGACAVLLVMAACTRTIEGSSTAAPVTKKSTEGQTVQAPDESYIYESGTVVTLVEATEDNDISGLLSSEVGRVLKFTVENDSEVGLDLSGTQADADVDCEGNDQYVFPSKEFVGPETLPAGDTADYELTMGLQKEDVGKTCTITFPFMTEDGSDVPVATFEMTL